jgi:HTH-type transcriptional regulator, transcriptional repressor of NAD biosynthesis genes
MTTHGMLLGKFLPPHLGHVYLAEFAGRYVDRLTVVVCSLKREPIPGELRFRWMRELLPFDNVVHLTDELPQEPGEHPDFWALWKASLERVLPRRPDYVFASEDYGAPLAEVLGGRFVPVDRARSAVAVSGTTIRSDPMRHWDFLPRCVRPYFLRRVCVFGPESTGKTTLARRLAEHFSTAWVPEYARTLIEAQGGQVAFEDMERIARGQAASEEALARNGRRVLVADTDVLTTLIWSETLFGRCPDWVREQAQKRSYDLHLLLDVDVPWVADVARYLPENRSGFFERCRQELEARQKPYVILRGGWEQRFSDAVAAIERLIAT